jgi:hypothetical protein
VGEQPWQALTACFQEELGMFQIGVQFIIAKHFSSYIKYSLCSWGTDGTGHLGYRLTISISFL